MVKEKLNKVFEAVAKVLNNTPSMAKNSYVHPAVITEWLDKLNLTPQFVGYKHITLESLMYESEGEVSPGSMDSLFQSYSEYAEGDVEGLDEEEAMEFDEYELPDWWDNEDIDLVKKGV